MTKPKRVSMKGRGSDLFFGDGAAEPATPNTSQAEPMASSGDQSIQAPASLQTSSSSTKQAGNIASKQASNQTRRSMSSPVHGDVSILAADASLASILEGMNGRAAIANTFRFTEEELARLEDVIYALTKSQRSKFSRQDVIRLGLNLALWDYEARGDASLLAQAAVRRKQGTL